MRRRYLRVLLFVACCILVAGAAQSSYYHGVDLDTLGLTPDQKSKIDAIVRNAQDQRSALQAEMFKTAQEHRDSSAAEFKALRKQHLDRQRKINEDEETQINALLTPAQQQKLRDLRFPKIQWGLTGYIFPDKDLSHYSVRLDSYPPPKYASYVIHRSDVHLSLLDYDGKPVSNGPHLALAADVPEIIRPLTDDEGPDAARLGLVMDRRGAKPGYYRIEFTAPVEATAVQTHERVKVRDSRATSAPPVCLTPQPDVEPALVVGQRFIGTPWEELSASTLTPYKDAKTDKPITWREIATKIATIQQVDHNQGGNRLTFSLEDRAGSIYLDTDRSATNLPYLTPLVTESVVRSLKAQYEEKQVWSYGGAGGACVSTEPGMSIGMSGGPGVSLRIRHVERVYLPLKELAIGNATFMGGERRSAFVTDNPLVVILEDPQKRLSFSGFAYGGKAGEKDIDKMSIAVVSNPRAHCLGLWNMFADRWDFEREYSLQSPLAAGKKWPAKMRKAVLKGAYCKGMTREMVAWAMGWPAIYGTKEEMLKESDWPYDNIPFEGHIYFKSGRMSGEEWPRLP